MKDANRYIEIMRALINTEDTQPADPSETPARTVSKFSEKTPSALEDSSINLIDEDDDQKFFASVLNNNAKTVLMAQTTN